MKWMKLWCRFLVKRNPLSIGDSVGVGPEGKPVVSIKE